MQRSSESIGAIAAALAKAQAELTNPEKSLTDRGKARLEYSQSRLTMKEDADVRRPPFAPPPERRAGGANANWRPRQFAMYQLSGLTFRYERNDLARENEAMAPHA
jgi:hypothetical protein